MIDKEKLSLIKQRLSRPVAYYRVFARIAGGATAGLMLSQAWYWTQTEIVRKRGGWFYKSAREWQDETGLTRREQETARKKLKARGLIEERLKGIPATINFRIVQESLIDLLKLDNESGEKLVTAVQSQPVSLSEMTCEITKAPDKLGQNSHSITENTQEITEQRIKLDNTTKDHRMPAASDEIDQMATSNFGGTPSLLKDDHQTSARKSTAAPRGRPRPPLRDTESGPVKRIFDFYCKVTGRNKLLTPKIRKTVASRISSDEALNPDGYDEADTKLAVLGCLEWKKLGQVEFEEEGEVL